MMTLIYPEKWVIGTHILHPTRLAFSVGRQGGVASTTMRILIDGKVSDQYAIRHNFKLKLTN